jgi:hypothetical protein
MSGFLKIADFAYGEPQTITIAGNGGRVKGKFGTQILYKLADGRSFYASEYLARAIEDAQMLPGEQIQVTKLEVKKNGKSTVAWEVQAVNGKTEPPTPLEQDLQQSIDQAEERKQGVSRQPAAAPQPSPAPVGTDEAKQQHSNGSRPVGMGTRMEQALKTAVHACR